MGINSPETVIRKPKVISNPKDIEYILSIDSEKAACKSTIMDLFADFGNGPRLILMILLRFHQIHMVKQRKIKMNLPLRLVFIYSTKEC